MIEGVLIAESLRVGAELTDLPLRVSRIVRSAAGSAEHGQPRDWTLLYFTAPDEAADRLASALAGGLAADGGWYCDFGTGTAKYVVFADRVFRYRRGDPGGGDEARAYGRSVGVPEPQLDWAD